MAHQELSEYVTEQIAQGVPAQIIKEALLSAGWMQADADNALRDAAAKSSPVALTSFKDDLVRVRHAVNSLDVRVKSIESRLAVAGPGEGMLESGVIGPDHELPPGTPWYRTAAPVVGFVTLFFVFGYLGMMLISRESLTPLNRIWVEAALGAGIAVGGFFAGRSGHRSMANVMTGIGLALFSLATVGAWYVHYLDWSVALALGALFVTLALVLGRFYDRWASK